MPTEPTPLTLEWMPGRFAVCRLDATAPIPAWASLPGAGAGALLCVTRTKSELSIVAEERLVPAEVQAARGWSAMVLAGVVDFALVGILSRLTGALAAAEVPVFVISTYDTDILLVREQFVSSAINALANVADVSALR
jgi:hypothetical protein